MLSMTAFARTQADAAGGSFTIELKSYNNRYLEFACNLPQRWAHLEAWTREQVSKKLARGKVSLTLKIDDKQNSIPVINLQKLQEFQQLQEQLAYKGNLPSYTLADLQTYGVFLKVEDDICPDAVYQETFLRALGDLQKARLAEGAQLATDLQGQLRLLQGLVAQIETLEEAVDAEAQESLKSQFEELVPGTVSEQRVLEEIAAYLIKINVHEELIRLKAHLCAMGALFAEQGPIGRKIDFFCQELQREATTMGNKTPNITVQHITVEIKNIVEKIREQARNVE